MDKPPDRPWYVAVLVFESSLVEVWHDPSIDVQYRLVRANDADQAYDRALILGEEGEHSYENPDGQTCVWSFRGLADLQVVMSRSLEDGLEIYGFIEDGSAEDQVVSKDELTVFRGRSDE